MKIKFIIIPIALATSLACGQESPKAVAELDGENPEFSYLDNYPGESPASPGQGAPLDTKSKQQQFNDIIAPLTEVQKEGYRQDLSRMELGNYHPYFRKMIDSSKSKMDVALVGIAATRVNELLYGDGTSPLLNGNVNSTIQTIQRQLSKAVASDNPVIKSITFQSMELAR